MKVYTGRPKKEIRIVKPAANEFEYEFWILTPVRIGGARRVGSQRIISDDGHEFVNLTDALLDVLDEKAHPELRREVLGIKPKATRVTIKGMELVSRDKWAAFCKLRKLDATSVAEMKKNFSVSPKELEVLGLTAP